MGGLVSCTLKVPVLNFISYGANIALPFTVSNPFVTRMVIIVEAGSPAPAAVKVILSCKGDQLNAPAMDGLVPNAACTLFVSIGLLNCNTMGEKVGTFVASWAGELLTTTGSSVRQSDCATKIFDDMPGTVIDGISGVAVTVKTSFVSNKFTIGVPGAKIVE